MSKDLIIVVVVLMFVAGMGALGYGLFGTVSVLPRLANTTMAMNDLPGSSQTLFSIGSVRYHSTTVTDESNRTQDICDSMVERQIVIMDLLYKVSDPPEACEIYVDDVYEKKLKVMDVPCKGNCSIDDIKLSVDIAAQDIYRSHAVQICCDQLCAKKDLPKLCG
jgi:hypothetical protein